MGAMSPLIRNRQTQCSNPKRAHRPGWEATIVTLFVIVSLSSSTWGAPLARVEDLPHLFELSLFQHGEPSLLYDDEGQAFAAIVPEYRVFVPLSKIPMHLRQAIIAAEDARFYQHGAIDL